MLIPSSRAGPLRVLMGLGVVACVTVAAVVAATRLDETLGIFDWRADENAARTYVDRLYGEPFNLVGSQKVLADALAWMPEGARYAVVSGPHLKKELEFSRRLAPEYLEFHLLPRRQVSPAAARWLFCYGCDTASFDERFRVLSDGGNGIVFGRLRR